MEFECFLLGHIKMFFLQNEKKTKFVLWNVVLAHTFMFLPLFK